jgi:hypothetical protein
VLPRPMKSLLDQKQKDVTSVELSQYGVAVLLDQAKH